MLKNYLLIAIRSLLKRKAIAAVNILGLSTGMAICLLIVVFISGELGYDRFVPGHENIYRVVVDRKYPDRSSSYSNIPQSYAVAIQAECPEVVSATRIFDFGDGAGLSFRYGDKLFEDNKVLLADSNFFEVFAHTFVAGDMQTALRDHNSLVITESVARKFFGDPLSAVGKQLVVAEGDRDVLQVNGVCRDWPAKSHFKFDMLRTTAGLEFAGETNFVNFGPHTYLRLHAGSKPGNIEQRFQSIIRKYATKNIEQAFAISIEQFQRNGNGYRYYLQPLGNIYLDSHLEGELQANGSRQGIYLFILIAIAVFTIACINFINISTARSIERSKEVGLRKTFGSEKWALVAQFLVESTVLALVSMVLAFAIALLLLPVFSSMINKPLAYAALLRPSLLLVMLLLALITGLVAGMYPAIVLSAFRPIEVLKGKFKNTSRGLMLRNGLVVFQFATSIILIICTLMVNRQMHYMTGRQVGFNQELVLIVERTDLLGDQAQAFKNEIRALPWVSQVSLASSMPAINNFFGISWQVPGSKEPLTGRGVLVDEDYAATLGLELMEGRFFSKSFSTDSLSLVLNEQAVKELGLKDPIGQELVSPEAFLNAPNGSQYRYRVIGVVKDFHYQSMHQQVNPLVFTSTARFGGNSFVGAIKLKPGNPRETIQQIEGVWKKFVKEKSLRYRFLDQSVARQYERESTTQSLFTLFSGLAIFIACIGLLGLAAYATQQKTHEISIRKVLGASVSGIIVLLSSDFLKLVALAAIIAFPIAWLTINAWLREFTYRVNIPAAVFAISGLAAFGVALLTISFFTMQAALRNPVKSLRTE